MDTSPTVLFIGAFVLYSLLEVAQASPSYNVELNSFKINNDYDTTWIDWDTMRMKKKSRTEIGVSGDISLKMNLGNEQKISLQIFSYNTEKKQRGPLVFSVEKPFCDFVDELEDTYQGMVESSNLPEKHECPFPKGDYTFNNYLLEANFLPDDTPKGDYYVVFTIKDGQRGVSGVDLETTLT